MSSSFLVQEKTFQNLISLSRNYSHLNFIDYLDFINENNGPTVLDLLTVFNIGMEQSVDEIEKIFDNSLTNIILDHVLQELGIIKNLTYEISVIKKKKLESKYQSEEYIINFEKIILYFIDKIQNSLEKFNLSKTEPIVDLLKTLGSSPDQSVIRFIKNKLNFDLKLHQVMDFLGLPAILSNETLSEQLSDKDRTEFEIFLGRNFKRSLNSYFIQYIVENFAFKIVKKSESPQLNIEGEFLKIYIYASNGF